ncbi:MAG TPA: DUF975 family protein [Lachnoclostridium phocaeense]|uniref:DUF975 family protein n=1 Tax=Lachnoclostridium phocaeense TaxID=1871021 RepID=A0A921LDT9_9FIRM|nr:DUF975 family protein [Lachnoclostridium phocaeense]
MPTRKEMKRRARRALKRHYILYVAICLIAAYIGSEFASSLNVLEISPASGYEAQTRLEKPSGTREGFADVMYDILEDGEEDGRALSQEIKEEELERSRSGNPAFGRTRGVLAGLVNSVTSGSILVSMLAALHSLTGSENLAVLCLILLGAAFLFAAWFFFVNIFKVISRRVFLEGRIYEKVPFQRMLFLLRVKKWTKVCCTMFRTSLYQMLWNFTIIGGVIKYYSYYLVPYIAAENPDISSREAISLSRRMMKGHKWECFVYELSFLPWTFLGAATLGLSEILYSNPYRAASFSEYYADLRAEAKKAHMKGCEFLNDTYLYEMPEDELIYLSYEDVISALIRRPRDILQLSGVRKFFADCLGVLLTNSKKEKEYEEMQARRVKMELLKDAVDRKAYPSRLSAVPEVEKRPKIETIHYLRHYSIWSIILLFFIFSVIGWAWEVSLHLVTDGEFVNRGVLHGPWLPIYGGGGVLILMLLNRLRNRPVLEFAGIVILCGCVEYATSLALEILHDGERWWDYSGYFLNLNGRICAEGLLVFGIGGIAIVYMLAPLLDNQIQRIRSWILIPLCLILLTVFAADSIYSAQHPNIGKGITDYEEKTACLQYIYPPYTYL